MIVQLLCLPAFDLLRLASAPWIPLLLVHFLVYLWVSLVKLPFGIAHLVIVGVSLPFGACLTGLGRRVATLLNPFTGPLLEGLSSSGHWSLAALLVHPDTCKGKCFVITQWLKAWAIERLKRFVLAWQSSTLSTKMHTTKKTSPALAHLVGLV